MIYSKSKAKVHKCEDILLLFHVRIPIMFHLKVFIFFSRDTFTMEHLNYTQHRVRGASSFLCKDIR